MNKKGSELSMNVIIIAAIGILILAILAMFIFGAAKNVGESTGCTAMNGRCDTIGTSPYTIRYPPGDNECNNLKCFIAVSDR